MASQISSGVARMKIVKAWVARSGGVPVLMRSSGHRAAGLEQRLQAADHAHPALAADGLGGARCALQPIVGDGQLADAVLVGLDLPADAALALLAQGRVVHRS